MKEVLFWRNVPILEKLGVEQFNHMIGKGFRKGGILMKQQLFPQGRDFLQRRGGRFRSSAPDPVFCAGSGPLYCRGSSVLPSFFCAAAFLFAPPSSALSLLCAASSLRRRRFFSGSALPLPSTCGRAPPFEGGMRSFSPISTAGRAQP